jgi:TolB protein
MIRYFAFFFALIALCTNIVLSNAFAQTDIYVRGAARLIPIGLPQLCLQGGDVSVAKQIPDLIARDLDLSGFFEVINPNAYIEAPGKCGGQNGIVYSDWSVLRADGVVRGEISTSGGSVSIRMYLHDVGKQAVVLGKEYNGSLADVSKIAHRFANELMKYYTGEWGPFGTQIAFSTKIGRFKELAVMDLDGSNLRQLTNDKSLSVSAAWAPDLSKLIYTSYRNRVPDIFTFDLPSRRVSQVTSNTRMDLGAKFLQNGSDFVYSTSDGLQSEIVIANNRGSVVRQLTRSNGVIDVSPHFSPDYSRIVFCSNRAGGPQIYTMNADGSDVKRVSFVTSNYCTSPSWSPKNDKIAFVCRADAGFQLFIANIDGSNPQQLTSYGDNEDPDWSPDGRYLTFGSTLGKSSVFSLALIRADGSNLKQLTNGRGGDSQPSWGPQLDRPQS